MFNQAKEQKQLSVGDYVIVGYRVGEKFVKVQCVDPKATIRVESIVDEVGAMRAYLRWSGGAQSFIYLHDEGKYWKRVENFN